MIGTLEGGHVANARRWSWFYARFLSWKFGREVHSPYIGDGFDDSETEQSPMRWMDTGEPVQFPQEDQEWRNMKI